MLEGSAVVFFLRWQMHLAVERYKLVLIPRSYLLRHPAVAELRGADQHGAGGYLLLMIVHGTMLCLILRILSATSKAKEGGSSSSSFLVSSVHVRAIALHRFGISGISGMGS